MCNILCGVEREPHETLLRVLPYWISVPLYMYMRTAEGCGLDPHVLPYIIHHY